MAYLVFRQLLVMTLICVIGYLLAKWKHFGEKESQFLSYLLLYVVTPCLIIDTYNVPFDGEKLTHFLIMLGLSTLTFVLLILFSALLFGKPKSNADDRIRSLDKMVIVYSNAGYIGIPIISAVLGQEAVFYLMVYILIFNTVLWIHGQYLMTRTISAKAVLTKPAVLASAFSILLFLSPWKLPYVVGSTVHLFATLNTPLSMVVIGIVFACFQKPDEPLSVTHLVRITFLRLIVVPMVVLLLLFVSKPFFSSHPTLQLISIILLIVSACPAGLVATNFALLYKKDYAYASFAIAVTTVLCVVTLPLCTALGEALLL